MKDDKEKTLEKAKQIVSKQVTYADLDDLQHKLDSILTNKKLLEFSKNLMTSQRIRRGKL